MYHNTFRDKDELHSIINIALMDAVRMYDPSRGAHFKTYAYGRVKSKYMDHKRNITGARLQHFIGEFAIQDKDYEGNNKDRFDDRKINKNLIVLH